MGGVGQKQSSTLPSVFHRNGDGPSYGEPPCTLMPPYVMGIQAPLASHQPERSC